MRRAGIFAIERKGKTVVLTLEEDLGEVAFMETNAAEVINVFDDPTIKNLVIDFARSDYFGSTTLAFFIRLWKIVTERNGKMVLCNLSEHEKEILTVTKLDHLCTMCGSREEAMLAIADS